MRGSQLHSPASSLSKSVSEKLFRQAKWKDAHKKSHIRMKEELQKNLAESKKTSESSEVILLTKHFKIIDGIMLQP